MPPLEQAAPSASPWPQGVPRLSPTTLLCLAASIGFTLIWWEQGGWVFPLDDAYITLHNARVVIEGRDPNYGVSALVGATSLVHLALVAAMSLVLPGEAASYVVACAGSLVFLSGLLTSARRGGLSEAETLLLGVAGLVTSAALLLNGLETGLALAAMTWALVLAADGPSRRLALICGVLPFVRPELGLLSATLMLRQVWLHLSAPTSRRKAVGEVAIDAALVLAAAAPWLAWTLSETGALLPATIAAKQAFFGFRTHSLPVGLGLSLLFVGASLGPAILAIPLMRRDSLALALWSFFGLFVLGYALTAPETLAQNEGRYAALLLPVALFALVRLKPSRDRTLLQAALITQGVTYAVLFLAGLSHLAAAQASVRDHRAISVWAQGHLPAGSRVLIHDAGMIAYASDLPLTDLVGLKSPQSVADHRRWTAPSGSAERYRALDAIARRANVTHAIILDDRPQNFWGQIADELRRAGWGVEPLKTPAASGPYGLYRLTRPVDGAGALTPDPAPDSGETRRPR